MYNDFENAKNIVKNVLLKNIGENAALSAVWEQWTSEADYSTVEMILGYINYCSPEKIVEVITTMINEGICPGKLLCKLGKVLHEAPYLIGIGKEVSFEEFINAVLSKHYIYTTEELSLFADLLEYLFAVGYKDLHSKISMLYQRLPEPICATERSQIHKQLMKVYSYNGMNYKSIYKLLCRTLEYCKDSKNKFMYGEIHYCFAVLEWLHRGAATMKFQEHLDKACDYRYELAYVLKEHS